MNIFSIVHSLILSHLIKQVYILQLLIRYHRHSIEKIFIEHIPLKSKTNRLNEVEMFVNKLVDIVDLMIRELVSLFQISQLILDKRFVAFVGDYLNKFVFFSLIQFELFLVF